MGFKAAPIAAMCSGYIVITVVRRSEEKGDRKWCICCDDSIEKFWQRAYTVGLSPQFKPLAKMNLSNGFLKDLCNASEVLSRLGVSTSSVCAGGVVIGYRIDHSIGIRVRVNLSTKLRSSQRTGE